MNGANARKRMFNKIQRKIFKDHREIITRCNNLLENIDKHVEKKTMESIENVNIFQFWKMKRIAKKKKEIINKLYDATKEV